MCVGDNQLIYKGISVGILLVLSPLLLRFAEGFRLRDSEPKPLGAVVRKV